MASSSPAIRISAKPKKPVSVNLVGVDYMIKPPKTALLLAISRHSAKENNDPGAISRDFDVILKLMFGKQAEAVQKRLDDPDDELDFDHIFEAVEAVTEDGTGNPTS